MFVVVPIVCPVENTGTDLAFCECKSNSDLRFTREALLHACPFLQWRKRQSLRPLSTVWSRLCLSGSTTHTPGTVCWAKNEVSEQPWRNCSLKKAASHHTEDSCITTVYASIRQSTRVCAVSPLTVGSWDSPGNADSLPLKACSPNSLQCTMNKIFSWASLPCLLRLLFFMLRARTAAARAHHSLVERVPNPHPSANAFNFMAEVLIFNSVKCLGWGEINCDWKNGIFKVVMTICFLHWDA